MRQNVTQPRALEPARCLAIALTLYIPPCVNTDTYMTSHLDWTSVISSEPRMTSIVLWIILIILYVAYWFLRED